MQDHYMSHQRVGHLNYRLYSLGWRSSLHSNLPIVQHWIFSLFLYYRRGFAEGSEWVKESSSASAGKL